MPYTINLSGLDLVEAVLALLLVAFGLFRPQLGREARIGIYRLLAPLARRPVALTVAATLAPILLRLLLLAVDPVPGAHVMEEFNHLLQADTYAHGRLSNPVHPLAVMLQGYQTIQWPHYLSARPPLPALFLYFGEAVTGSPFIGNLIGVGLLSGALSWMLQGWLDRSTAAVGSALVVIVFCLFGYWVNSYWCPTPILLGAALVTGLVPRIERSPRFAHAVVLIASTTLLLGTRPVEDGVFLAVVALWLVIRLTQPECRHLLGRGLVRVALPALVGGVVVVLGQLAYDKATIGIATQMPYQIWRASQGYVPAFLWQPIVQPPLVFYHPGARLFAEWEAQVVRPVQNGGVIGWTLLLGRHAVTLRDQLGPMLFLPLLCWSPRWISGWAIARQPVRLLLCWLLLVAALLVAWLGAGLLIQIVLVAVLLARWPDERQRLPIVLILVGLFVTSLSSFYMTIYFSCYFPALLIVVMAGLRDLGRWRGGCGAALAGMVMIGCGIMPAIETCAFAAGRPSYGASLSRFDPVPFEQRRSVLAQLSNRRRALVMVRYVGREDASQDPVWNGAAVDDQRIVWARDLRPDWTAAAHRYYPDRDMWLATVARSGPAVVVPYPVDRLPPPAALSSLPVPDRAAAFALGAR